MQSEMLKEEKVTDWEIVNALTVVLTETFRVTVDPETDCLTVTGFAEKVTEEE